MNDESLWSLMKIVFLLTVAFASCGLNAHALVTCYPQTGKWTPWTGTICYGERP